MWRCLIRKLGVRDWGLGSVEDLAAIEEGFENLNLAGGFVQAEEDQIGAIAGIETTLAGSDSADAGRISSGERNGFAQAETGGPHDVRDGVVHRKSGTGQTHAAGETYASIVVQFDVDFAQAIGTGSAAGRHDGVGYQDGSLQAFGAQGDVQESGRKMEPIDDEAGRQAIVGQLVPNVVGGFGQ